METNTVDEYDDTADMYQQQKLLEGEQKEKEVYKIRLSRLSIRSERLERARNNPKAMKFFQREPIASEGYDRLWVSAIDYVCFNNLIGTFRNYGIQFADNFGDWQDECIPDGFASIEHIAHIRLDSYMMLLDCHVLHPARHLK